MQAESWTAARIERKMVSRPTASEASASIESVACVNWIARLCFVKYARGPMVDITARGSESRDGGGVP